jgi:hypothetical protein
MAHPSIEAGTFKNITATALVANGAGQMIGFYVNSTSTGTIVFRDGTGGTVMSGTITPAIGFHRFPAVFGTGLHATIANTLDVTIFFTS